MSNIIISERNEEGFSAILEAFQSAIETDVIPMSSFSVEPGDSEKTVQIEAKVHVPSAKRIIVRDSGGNTYQVIQPSGASIVQKLEDAGVEIQAVKQEKSGFMSSLGLWLPFLVIIGIWIFLMNRMQGGGRGGAMGFGKSKAKLLTEKHGKVTFNDVAGIDEAKEEVEEIVEF